MRLFFTLFFLCFLGLSLATAGLVAGSVHFFSVDPEPWTQLAWNSRPVLVGVLLGGVSFLVSAVASVFWKILLGFVSGGPRKRSSSRSAARTPSRRRTTV